MDHLQRLPNEILLQILQSCTDLSALRSLVNTSRLFSSIFENNTPTLTIETVLQSGIPDPVSRLMRMVIYIQAGVFKHHRWGDLGTVPLHRFSKDRLVTAALLRKFLHLAQKIYDLAHLCLEGCLQRCMDLAGRRRGGGPLSCTEEQRTILSLWRVQYFYELKVARLKGRLRNGWDVGMLSVLGSATIIDGGEFSFQGFQREQVMTIVKFLDEINESNTGRDISAACRPRPSGSFRLSGLGYTEVGGPRRLNGPPSSHSTSPSRLSEQLLEEPVAWSYLNRHARPPANNAETFSLRRLPFEPFRKLGLFLWDRQRMAELGLWPDPGRDFLHFDEGQRYFSAWMRLLTPEEVARAVGDEADICW